MTDYLTYAIRRLQMALDKLDDAPASSMLHEEQAIFALNMKRIPEPGEVLQSLSTLETACNALREIADANAGWPSATKLQDIARAALAKVVGDLPAKSTAPDNRLIGTCEHGQVIHFAYRCARCLVDQPDAEVGVALGGAATRMAGNDQILLTLAASRLVGRGLR